MNYTQHLKNQLYGMLPGDVREIDDTGKYRQEISATLIAIGKSFGWQFRTRKVGGRLHVQRCDGVKKPFKNTATKSALIENQISDMVIGECRIIDPADIEPATFSVLLSTTCKRLGWLYKTKNIMGLKHFWRLS